MNICVFDESTLEYLLEREKVYLPSRNYLEVQPHISEDMRSILFDWMMEVCVEFLLKSKNSL